jgi:hypothetical protein
MPLCHACKLDIGDVFHLGEFRLCSDCLEAGRLRELLKLDSPAVAQTVNGTGHSGPIVILSDSARH